MTGKKLERLQKSLHDIGLHLAGPYPLATISSFVELALTSHSSLRKDQKSSVRQGEPTYELLR